MMSMPWLKYFNGFLMYVGGVEGTVSVFVDFWHFLIWCTTRCLMLIMYISCPVLESAIAPRSPTSFLLENGIRKQDLGASCAYCHFGIVTSGSS